MSTTPTPQQVLACPMPDNDADAVTVRDYLILLLLGVWKDRECFNGKRPFGNSGWQYELCEALANAGWITCTRDEDGDITDIDRRTGDRLIDDAIVTLS